MRKTENQREKRRLQGLFAVFLLLTAVCFTGCGSGFMGFASTSAFRRGGAESEAASPSRIQAANDKSSHTLGYSYVDFSGMDTGAVFPVESAESLLGQPGYCYSTLTREEQQVYEEIYAVLTRCEDSRELSSTDAEVIRRVYTHVMADHPEIFWVDGYTLTTGKRGDQVVSARFSARTTMDGKEIQSWQKKIQSWIDVFSREESQAGIAKESQDYEKIRFTFDYLVEHTEYQEDARLNQTICSVFGDGASVCQGYSVSMQYLLLLQGIPAITVSGKTDGVNHGWNLVQSDGDWYHLDVTWGDPSFSDKSQKIENLVNYTCFCVTDEEIKKSHTPDGEITLPSCTAVQDNYYVREHCDYQSWDKTARKSLQENLTRYMKDEKNMISIRLGSRDAYQKMRKELLTNNKIFDLLEKAQKSTGNRPSRKISYLENQDAGVITWIW